MKIGYARGTYSSIDVEQMITAFNGADCGSVVIDVLPERSKLFNRVLERLSTGDTLAAWNSDCVARTFDDLVGLIHRLNQQGIGFESMSPHFSLPCDSSRTRVSIEEAVRRSLNPPPRRKRAGRRPARPVVPQPAGLPDAATAGLPG